MHQGRQLISNANPMEEIVGFSRAVRVGPYICVGGTPLAGLANTISEGFNIPFIDGTKEAVSTRIGRRT